MSVRVLFCPWSAGGGAGYTGRCLAAADRLGPGFTVAFGPSSVGRMVAAAGYPTVGTPAPERRPARVPPYLPFANVERVYAVAAHYYRRARLAADLDRDLAAVDAYRPDIVVTDMQPTAVLAARARALPVVSLADTDFLSAAPNAWMPWSDADPAVLLPAPSALNPLNELAAQQGLAPVSRVTDLLWADLTLVPSAPEVEPPPAAPAGRRPPVYIGPLYWDPPGPAYRPASPPGRRRVYVTIGSGGMVTTAALREVLRALDRPGIAVFLSAGFATPPWLSEHPAVEVAGFTGLTGPLAWADLVVSHGGYSTVLAALAAGLPQVVLPFMSEQEANGRSFVSAHGAGLVARTTDVDATGRVRYVNRHGGPTRDPVVPAHDLARTVDEVFADSEGADRAGYAADALAGRRGAADLDELFRSVLATGPADPG